MVVKKKKVKKSVKVVKKTVRIVKFKVPQGTSDINFYDKEKYNKLLLSPYEFRVGDRVINKDGMPYDIISNYGESHKAKFVKSGLTCTQSKYDYNCKRVVLRPKYVTSVHVEKIPLTKKEKTSNILNLFLLEMAIIIGAIYTDIFMRAELEITSIAMGGMVVIWFVIYSFKLCEVLK